MLNQEQKLANSSKLDDSKRQRCEVWTRVMGYHRPTNSFNQGKQAEYSDREMFKC